MRPRWTRRIQMDATFVSDAAATAATISLSTCHPTQFVDLTDRLARIGRRRRLPLRHPQRPDASHDDGDRRQRARAAAADRLRRRCSRPPRRPTAGYQHDDCRVRTVNLTAGRAPQRSCALPRPAAAVLGLPERGRTAGCCSDDGSACSSWSWTARASGRFRCSLFGEARR